MTRGRVVTALALLLLVVALGKALFVRRPVVVDAPPGREARNNPYLAAQRFLENQRIGVDVRRNPRQIVRGVALLPSTTLLDDEAATTWLRWVREGGYLIAGVGDDSIRRRMWSELDLPIKTVRKGTAEGDVEKLEIGPLQEGGGEALTIEFRGKVSLDPVVATDADVLAFEAPTHVPVVLLKVGKGKLLLLADDQIFANGRIGDADHAAFLWRTVVAGGVPGRIELILRHHPPRPVYYLALAWPLWLALGVWLATFLWNRGGRFGPLREAPISEQRGIRDHLRAAARFLWRQRTAEDLVAAARRAFERRAAAALPGWAQLAPEERAAALQAALRPPALLARAAIDTALQGPVPRSPAAFQHLIATLETLRRSL